MFCPSSSGSHSVPSPVAKLQASTAAFNTLQRRGGGEQLISPTLTDSAITEASGGKKKSGPCHSRSLSSINSLYKSYKRKASQNDVAKKKGEKTQKQVRWNILLQPRICSAWLDPGFSNTSYRCCSSARVRGKARLSARPSEPGSHPL